MTVRVFGWLVPLGRSQAPKDAKIPAGCYARTQSSGLPCACNRLRPITGRLNYPAES
ncbi:MAG: hypothetical protein JWM19_3319 [Actinomycetia bacterium]|jgi:hypothetical protein|nr:hypothetical protein [Actinomycetes bacterium]